MEQQIGIAQLQHDLFEVKKEISTLKEQLDNLSILTSNQNGYVAVMVQSINSQITAINDLSRNVQSLYSKISDMEINQSNMEDSIQDVSSEQKSISQDNSEIKESIETMKFYVQNMVGYRE